MYSDFWLIRKIKQGDDTALDLFVRKYYQKVMTYCNNHCLDKIYAEDLTQETFVRFFSKLSDYNYKGKTLNYLYTIASNLCKDYIKKIKEMPLEEKVLEEECDIEEYQMDNILNKVYIEEILKQLPNELRDVIILYYFEGLKLIEISDRLQIGLPLVKYRFRQAKKQLEVLVRKEENNEP